MLQIRIRELRKARGYSQVELAEKIGVSKQAISNWENDNIQPSIEMLIRLADVFGVTTDYLLGREKLCRIDVDGVPAKVVAHILALIDDFRNP